MERSYKKFQQFQKVLYNFETIKELPFKLLNILSLICFGGGTFYCFCSRYGGCKKNITEEKNVPRSAAYRLNFQTLRSCRTETKNNLEVLKKFSFDLYPYLEELFLIEKHSMEAFCSEYTYSYHAWYTGQKSEVFLKEMS